jgi:hypothetical protein
LLGTKTFNMKKIILFIAFAIASSSYAQSDVTFKVDMNEYSGDFTEVQLNGTFNGWCGSCNPMTDDDLDGVWEATVAIEAGDIEFKYTYDNWVGQEELTPGSECTITTDGFTNRTITVGSDTILPIVCWDACVACTGTSTSADVTFQVDMNEYVGDFTEVQLNGTFNGWCGACTPMTDDDLDGIWEVSLPVEAGTIEFKYTFDNWTGQEEFTEGDPCTSTIDGFTNRTMEVSVDSTLNVVCWGSCVACVVGIEESTWAKDLVISPNPSNGIFKIQGEFTSSVAYFINVTDIQGKVVFQSNNSGNYINQRMNLSEVENGLYIVTISSELGSVAEKIFINK